MARVPKTTTPPAPKPPELEISRFIVQVVCVDEHRAIQPWPVDQQGNHGSFVFQGDAAGDATKHLVDWATTQLPLQLAAISGNNEPPGDETEAAEK